MRRGRGGGPDGSVEVELEEESAGPVGSEAAPRELTAPPASTAPTGAAPDDGASPPGRAGRGGRRVGLVALVAAVVGVGVLNAALAYSDHRDREALAAVPGLLAPLPEAPVVRWTEDGHLVTSTEQGLVVSASDGQGLALLDVATGTPLWRAAPPEDGYTWWDCRAGSSSTRSWWWGPGQPTVEDVILCMGDRWMADAATGGLVNSTVVDAVDLGSGAVTSLGDHRGYPMSALLHEGGAVVATWEDPGTLRVTRHDLASSEVEWTHTHEAASDEEGGSLGWHVDGGHAVLEAEDGDLRLDLLTGDLTEHTADLRGAPEVLPLPLPDLSEVHLTRLADGRLRQELRTPDGDVLHEAMDHLPPAPVLDPRTQVLLLSSWSDLAAVDVRTGEVVWRSDSAAVPELQVDGVAVLSEVPFHGGSEGGEVRAVDERTGEALWSRSSGPTWIRVASDGTRALLTEGGDHGASGLAAVGLRDGTEHWHVTLPLGTQSVRSVDGHLVVQAPGSVHVYGRPD